MDGNKHYIRLNEAGTIVYGFSSAFEDPQESDICINEDAPRHFHEAFTDELTDSRGIYLFKYSNAQIVPRTAQEIASDVAQLPTAQPSIEERVKFTEDLLLEMMLGGI